MTIASPARLPVIETSPPPSERLVNGYWSAWIKQLEVGQALLLHAEHTPSIRGAATRLGRQLQRKFTVRIDRNDRTKVRCYRLA